MKNTKRPTRRSLEQLVRRWKREAIELRSEVAHTNLRIVTIRKRTRDLVELLDRCDAALTAAGAELWDQRRDLAIACNQRAQRCRVAAKEVLS